MSVLKSVRETISVRFEALTPPTDASVTYRRLRQLGGSEDVVGRREFWFSPPTGGRETQWESSFTTVRSSFDIRVLMIVDGRMNQDLFDEIADEAILLINTINLASGSAFADGVGFVQAAGWTLEQAPDGLEMIIAVETETNESDGA
jgi:hypothetical protein